jgi:hypothetical protein
MFAYVMTPPTCFIVVARKEKGMRANPHKDDSLLELVGDLCVFILD